MNLDRLRDELRRREGDSLASYATRSRDSRGRVHPEPEHPLRSPFQRDRDRIIHSHGLPPPGVQDPGLRQSRGRLLPHAADAHDGGGADRAHAWPRRCGLNEDLGEAVALAHDLGHTPFGHAGERVLHELMAPTTAASSTTRRACASSTCSKSATRLSRPQPHAGRCARASSSTRRAYDKPLARDFEPGEAPCLEAQIVDFADEIAYNSHDIDDGLEVRPARRRAARRRRALARGLREARAACPRRRGAHPALSDGAPHHRRARDRPDRDACSATVEQHGVRIARRRRAGRRPPRHLQPAMAEKTRALKAFLDAASTATIASSAWR